MKKGQKIKKAIINRYVKEYGELPMVPKIQCNGINDSRYLKMLKEALDTGVPVTDEDLEKYFPDTVDNELVDI